MAAMLGIVVLVALGLASLRSASVFWTSAAAFVTLGMLLTAIVGVCFGRGSTRAFWSGFAVFGWTYLLMVNWSWFGAQFGHDLTTALTEVAEAIHPDVSATQRLPTQPTTGRLSVMPPLDVEAAQQRYIKIGNFVEIGRALLGLIFGTVGGYVALIFKVRSERPRSG